MLGTKKTLQSPEKTNTKVLELEWLHTPIQVLKPGRKESSAFKILKGSVFLA